MSKPNLHDTTDAQVWAKEWLETISKNPSIPTDEGTMIGWFANALMAGYDACYAKYKFAMTEEPYEEIIEAFSKSCQGDGRYILTTETEYILEYFKNNTDKPILLYAPITGSASKLFYSAEEYLTQINDWKKNGFDFFNIWSTTKK